MGALSRAIALVFQPGEILTAGDNLVLGINPTAKATTRELQVLRDTSLAGGELATDAQAFARGIGAGNSRFLSDVGIELTYPSAQPLNHYETEHGDLPVLILPTGRFTGTVEQVEAFGELAETDTGLFTGIVKEDYPTGKQVGDPVKTDGVDPKTGQPIAFSDPATVDDASLYNSPNLTIKGGGGTITGTSDAIAYTSGRGNTYTNAEAIQIGLANINFTDRFGRLLQIGTQASPLTAKSLTIDDSLLGDVRGGITQANIKSTAIVRGLEGGGNDVIDPTTGKVDPAYGNTLYTGNLIYGQPLANVAADAQVDHRVESDLIKTTYITADAKGLENAVVYNVPNGSGNGVATMGGSATAKASMIVGSGWDRLDPADAGRVVFTPEPNPNLQIISQAIGVDGSTLYGAPTLNSTITGSGLATVDLASRNNHIISPSEVDRINVVGIGIRDTEIYTHRGNDLIAASGGVLDDGIYYGNRFNHVAGVLDSAGFDNVTIYANEGDDRILGLIMSETDAGLDANGDGILSNTVYLDQGARDPYELNGYNGFRNTKVDSGMGSDVIRGASNVATFYGSLGNDSIVLDRAKDTALWGGADDDYLQITGNVRGDINLWGDIGNDILISGKQADSIFNLQTLDGGYGQDILVGNAESVDNFLMGNGGASLMATSSKQVNTALTDPAFWAKLNPDEKNLLWKEGVLLGAQTVAVQNSILANRGADGSLTANGTGAVRNIDVISNFEAGPWRDTVELNAALANLDETTWKSEGTLFKIGSDGELDAVETSANHPNRIGLIVGSLQEIHNLGKAMPSIAYASDTRQLLYDADGDWSSGSISMGIININNGAGFNHSNVRFGSATGEGMGVPIPL